jgi:hypothetical protein
MRLCEEKGQVCANRLTDPRFSKPCANPQLYRFEFIGQRRPPQGTNVSSTVVSETAAVLLCFLSNKAELPMKQKLGRKNEPTRLGTLGQANAKAFTTTK